MEKCLKIKEGFYHAGEVLDEIISADQVQERVRELGKEISAAYKGRVPIIIGVLNGAFLFMADLVRNLNIDFEVDFIKIDSYGNGTQSTGTVRLLKDISADITGRDVLLVEDIVDTGLSLEFLKHRLEEANPNSLRFATCLYKPTIAKHDFKIDWIGFNIEDRYVVGYGLDMNQKLRGLPAIYAFKEERK